MITENNISNLSSFPEVLNFKISDISDNLKVAFCW